MLKTLAEMAATIAAVPLYIHYLPGIACADMEAALQTGFALALLYLLLQAYRLINLHFINQSFNLYIFNGLKY